MAHAIFAKLARMSLPRGEAMLFCKPQPVGLRNRC
jgi:hypothetical protein